MPKPFRIIFSFDFELVLFTQVIVTIFFTENKKKLKLIYQL